MKLHALLTAAALAFAAPALAQSPKAPAAGAAAAKKDEKPAATPEVKPRRRPRRQPQGRQGPAVGDVTLEQTPHGVLVKGTLSNLPAGSTPSTSTRRASARAPSSRPPAATSTRTRRPTACMSPGGKHEGDLPNLTAGQDGKVQFEFFADDGLTVQALHGHGRLGRRRARQGGRLQDGPGR